MSEKERAARQQPRYKRRNAARCSVFAKLDAASEWVRNDPYLAAAWALNHSITTAETTAKRRCRLDGELPKIGEEWSLSNSSANAGRGKAAASALRASSALAATALCTE